jgi:LDH2 family malate/lactate/ureidoglycolate dehydrogenase
MLTKVFQISRLEEIMAAALAEKGVSEGHRREIVEGVLFGSLRGVETHGLALFRTYLEELSSGRANVRPLFRYQQGRGAIARLDADGALGIVASFEATRRTALLAREHGIGAVVVANSNHFGPASLYTVALARQGLIGLVMSNSDALVVPMNGTRPRMGTNPISLAVEGEGDMFCADLATSQGSFLKSLAMRAAGGAIPAGLLVDGNGRDVADSGGVPAALLPLGGHKGQCLGMMVSILTAVLAGEPVDWELVNLFQAPADKPRRTSHLFLAIDVSSVTDAAQFRARLADYLGAIRETPSVAGKAVACPGDWEAQTTAERGRTGIPLRDEDAEFFNQLARAQVRSAQSVCLP